MNTPSVPKVVEFDLKRQDFECLSIHTPDVFHIVYLPATQCSCCCWLTKTMDCVQRLIEMRSDENERTRVERSKREKKRQEKEMLRLNEQ